MINSPLEDIEAAALQLASGDPDKLAERLRISQEITPAGCLDLP